MIAELEVVVAAIPQSKSYIATLDGDIEKEEKAAISGDKAAMVKTIEQGAKDTKAGAKAVISNKVLYKLADIIAPEQFQALVAGIKRGTKGAVDENELMGAFLKLVKAALTHH